MVFPVFRFQLILQEIGTGIVHGHPNVVAVRIHNGIHSTLAAFDQNILFRQFSFGRIGHQTNRSFIIRFGNAVIPHLFPVFHPGKPAVKEGNVVAFFQEEIHTSRAGLVPGNCPPLLPVGGIQQLRQVIAIDFGRTDLVIHIIDGHDLFLLRSQGNGVFVVQEGQVRLILCQNISGPGKSFKPVSIRDAEYIING